MNENPFTPANEFTDPHGLFVALVGGPNSGKTYSALTIARGIAGPDGKIAVIDSEGGRTLHLKDQFAFDVVKLDPPHRPMRYLRIAQRAQAAGYAALVIDSFTTPWRGLGGVLDWQDEILEAVVRARREKAERMGWEFDEEKTRNANKMAASIEPKMDWKLMVAGLLGLSIPIIFSIRGEMTLDPDTKKEVFKAQMQKGFLFEVTVSFRLSTKARGVIDLSQPDLYKMERAHRPIFRDGDLISLEHGAKLAAWARGEGAEAPEPEPQRQPLPIINPSGDLVEAKFEAQWVKWGEAFIAKLEDAPALGGWLRSMEPHLTSLEKAGHARAVQHIRDTASARLDALAEQQVGAE
jgi:hypothetical protein